MRTRLHARILPVMGLCALLALAFACKQKAPTTKGSPGATTRSKPAAAGPVAAVPAPQAVEIKDLAVALRFKPINEVLPKIQGLIVPFAPNVSADTIKATLGAALGDPTLANLDPTRGILVCVFDPGGGAKPSAAGVIPVLNEQYKTLFQARGLMVHQEAGGKTLLVAQNEAGMVAARSSQAELEKLLKAPSSSDVSVYVNVDKLLTNHQADIETMKTQMLQGMNAAAAAGGAQAGGAQMMQMLAMEVNGFLSVAKDLQDLEVTLAMSNKGVEIGATVRAKAGSELAGLFDKPAQADAKLLGYLPGTGAVQGYYGGSADAADYFAAKIDDAIASVPDAMTPEQRKSLKALILKSASIKQAGAIDILTPGSPGLSGISIRRTSDPAAYLKTMREMTKNMEAAGLSDMYKKMGMDVQIALQENVRTYKGVPIHKYTQKMTMPQQAQMPPQFAMIMNMFTNIEIEMAIIGDVVINDMGTNKMNDVIDAVKAKKALSAVSLNAEKMFGKNGDLYLDVHVGRLASFVVGMVQTMMGPMLQGMDQQIAKITAGLKSLKAQPISIFAASGKGNFAAKINIPLDPIVKIKDLVQAAMQPPAPVAP